MRKKAALIEQPGADIQKKKNRNFFGAIIHYFTDN